MATTSSVVSTWHSCCCTEGALSLSSKNCRLSITVQRSLFLQNAHIVRYTSIIETRKTRNTNMLRCASEDPSEAERPPEPQKRRRQKSDSDENKLPFAEDASPKVKKRQGRKSVTVKSNDDEQTLVSSEKKKRVSKPRKEIALAAEDSVASLSEESIPIKKSEDVPKKKLSRRRKEPASKEKGSISEISKSSEAQKIARAEKTDKEEEDKTEKAVTRMQGVGEGRIEDVKRKTIVETDKGLVEAEEEEEEEEEEDEGDEEYEEDVGKPKAGSLVEKQFPDEECYALVSSYKPRKVDNEPPPLSNDELWWNWRKPKPDDHVWSEFQKRPGLPDITMAAMAALTGQIKLFGDTPTVTETHIHRARKRVLYEERLAEEERRRKEIGPMAYYQEWVKAWDKDTSKEAVQKHYEETGEDVAVQLMNMLACQTREEYRYMMGTDVRIKRDPLVMRATKEMKRSVFGGDPVYPTVNYIQHPDAVVDYRGPNYHEPTPTVIEHLLKCGTMKTRAEHNRLMALEQQQLEEEEETMSESDEPGDEMAAAIDIGEKDVDVDEDEVEQVEDDVEVVPPEKLIQLSDDEEPEEPDDLS